MAALILAVSQSRPKPLSGREEAVEMLERMKEKSEVEQLAWVTLTFFFWVLVLALLSAIMFQYMI